MRRSTLPGGRKAGSTAPPTQPDARRQQARLTLSATLAAGASETQLRARLSPVTPSVIARAAPSLAALAALERRSAARRRSTWMTGWALRDARFSLRAGGGQVRIGSSDVPFLDAALVASGTPDVLTVQTLRVNLPGRAEARRRISRRAAQCDAAPSRSARDISVDLNQVDFADLARFGRRERPAARRLAVGEHPGRHRAQRPCRLGLAASANLSSRRVDARHGTLDGRAAGALAAAVPPIDNGQAQLRILDPDTLEISVTGGRQRLPNQKEASPAGLQIRSGQCASPVSCSRNRSA